MLEGRNRGGKIGTERQKMTTGFAEMRGAGNPGAWEDYWGGGLLLASPPRTTCVACCPPAFTACSSPFTVGFRAAPGCRLALARSCRLPSPPMFSAGQAQACRV